MKFPRSRTLIIAAIILVTGAWAEPKASGLYDGPGDEIGAKGESYALLIGVKSYDNGIRPLQYTVNDVEALHRALIDPKAGGFKESNVVVLHDNVSEKPTLREINKKLNWLQIKAKPEDMVVIYFSGHGESDGDWSYLLTKGTDPAALETTALNVATFNKLVARIPARKKIVFLDACHSGGVTRHAKSSGAAVSQATYERLHRSAEGEVRFLSCRQDELSYETEKLGQGRGVFSYFLVKALTEQVADKDSNGLLTVSELEEYLTTHVSDWAAKQAWRQTPVAEKRVAGEIVLARVGAIHSVEAKPTVKARETGLVGSKGRDVPQPSASRPSQENGVRTTAPPGSTGPSHVVQIGCYSQRRYAQEKLAELEADGLGGEIVEGESPDKDPLYRVFSPRTSSRTLAEELLRKYKEKGHDHSFIVDLHSTGY